MNVALPPDPAPGEPLRASWGQQLLRWCRANALVPTPGMLLSRTLSGTSYRPEPSKVVAAAAAATCFLQVSDATGSDHALKVRVSWGTIVGRQPTGFAAGDDPIFTLPITDSTYVYAYADANLTDVRWTGAGVVVNDDPFLTNTTTRAYRMIGSVSVDTDTGKISATTSTCGEVDFDFCELADA